MIPSNKRPVHPIDPFEEQADGVMRRALADLDAAYAAAPPPRLCEDMDRAVYARMTALGGGRTAPRRSFLPPWRRPAGVRLRLVSLVAALLLALSAALSGYLRVDSPTPVNAQTVRILHRAAAALHLAPNQAAHATYSVTVSTNGNGPGDTNGKGSLTGTADVWVQTDGSGAPALSAQTLTMPKSGMTSRFTQMGQDVYAYNPEMRGDNTITINAARAYPSWLVPADIFEGSSVAQELSALATRSPQRVRLLPQQTLDGYTVDAIEVDGWTNRPAQRTIFYVDAQSYVLRGFDASSQDPSYPMPSWQARLNSYTTMPAAAVPSGTFTLNAPATARVHLPDLGDPAAFKTLANAFAATCHSSGDVNLKMLLSSGQSLLAACQATTAGTSQADLVAGLSAPQKAAVDVAVAASQITQAQATDSLAALDAWLSTWITTVGGQSK